MDDESQPGAVFWATAAIGAVIVAFGIRGLLDHEPRGARSAATWFVGGAVLMDLVVVPVGAVVGLLAKRVVTEWAWPIVRTALITSVVLIVVSGPLVLGLGGNPDNPSVRPRNYAAGLLGALVVTWSSAAVWLVVRRARRRTLGPPGATERAALHVGTSRTTADDAA